MSLFPLAQQIPESLLVSQNQLQTITMDTGGSLKVNISIISIGTKPSWKSASVRESVADKQNGLLRVPRNLNCQYQHWHQNSWKFASVHQKVAGQWNSLSKVLRGQKYHYFYWHQNFLKVCDCLRIARSRFEWLQQCARLRCFEKRPDICRSYTYPNVHPNTIPLI
jgi:hypothetical protein